VEARLSDVRLGGAWTTRQRCKNGLIYGLVRAAIAFASRAPRFLVRAILAFAAHAAWLVAPNLRRRVAGRLEAGLGRSVASSEVRSAFATAGAALASMALLFREDEPADASLAMDHASAIAFREALDEGRGVVYVTAHLGPWERMAALLVERGFPVATVARESYDPRLTEAVYERLRARRGVRSIYRGETGAAIRVARELGRGGAVGFLIDLPSRGVASLEVPLFGLAHPIPIGPARFALARGAAVVVGTAGSGRVTVRRVPSSDLEVGEAGERALLRRIATELETRIAAAPGAWLGLFAPQDLNSRQNPR
jgi:KDO2-lipid IV(A) lauroyltransferase